MKRNALLVEPFAYQEASLLTKTAGATMRQEWPRLAASFIGRYGNKDAEIRAHQEPVAMNL